LCYESAQGNYLFMDEQGRRLKRATVGHFFRKACVRAGIEDFRFHDLRHEYGSRLGDADVNLKKIARLMGHSKHQADGTLRPPDGRGAVGGDGDRGAAASFQNRSAEAQGGGMRFAVNRKGLRL
jgi:hypothetical protein